MAQKYLKQAIHDQEVVTFDYQGVSRVVEPYVLGLSAEGDITLSAWQISGEGGTGWRNYLINKIRVAKPTELYFRKPRQGYSPSRFMMQHILAWVGAPVRRPQDLFF